VRMVVVVCILEPLLTIPTCFYSPFMERVYFHFEGFVVFVVETIFNVDLKVVVFAKVVVAVAVVSLSCYVAAVCYCYKKK
jgi:hypothetical protein